MQTFFTFMGTLIPTTYTLSYILNSLTVPPIGTSLIIGAATGGLVLLFSHRDIKKRKEKEGVEVAAEYFNTYFEEEDKKIAHHIKEAREKIFRNQQYRRTQGRDIFSADFH